MAYREDPSLAFLGLMESEDLEDLVYCLTHDKDGVIRLTEELTETQEYKNSYPNHHKYWKSIAGEIQTFGANSFITPFRGGGVLYHEVLTDVCDKLNVRYNKKDNVDSIENDLLIKIFKDAVEHMTPAEIKSLGDALGKGGVENFSAQVATAVLQGFFKLGGFQSYQMAAIVANAVMRQIFNRGLSLAGNAALSRGLALLAGPVGWAITTLWTAVDLAGPAYRVTIPAVIQVASLRKKRLYEVKQGQAYFS